MPKLSQLEMLALIDQQLPADLKSSGALNTDINTLLLVSLDRTMRQVLELLQNQIGNNDYVRRTY